MIPHDAKHPHGTVPGTCVALDGSGVLLQGPSGAGKSDLALRLIDEGARLVADDVTAVDVLQGSVYASPPSAILGLLEVRGIGIIQLTPLLSAPLVLVVDLVPPDAVERLPEAETRVLLGVALPLLRLVPFEASAPAKVRLAVRIATGDIIVRR